jgi:MOSC domain-containing protein YiiM/SAM-dependent methyltransferase
MTSNIHDAAARGFSATVDVYERSRPSYPPAAVASLAEALRLGPDVTLLEVGAGTGKLTTLLAPGGARIVAVEPLAAMRDRLAANLPGTDIRDGVAEALPLANGSVDAVVAAQAFHWFDHVRAISETHRVLRPGGRFALAWNFRDEAVPWVRGLGERIRTLAGGEPQVWDREWRDALARSGLFGAWASVTFRHAQRLTREGVLDRVASVSFIAAAEPSVRAGVLADVAAMLDEDPGTRGRELIDLPYVTELMWAERASPVPSDAGVVASVNLNAGGVPKPPVDGTRILRRGLEGDGPSEPEPVHGGPDQAVSLYTQEAIERVRADGHEAFPGAYGENLTLLGLEWPLEPGDRLSIGDPDTGPVLEVVSFAAPCQTIAHWFDEGRIARISPKVRPEDARRYARVLREGAVAPGMPIRRVPG